MSPKPKTAKRKPVKSMKERIETAIIRGELLQNRSREAIFIPTGQRCFDFPHRAQTPQPWPMGCSRILIPLPEPDRRGHRAREMIVRNEKLKFESNG